MTTISERITQVRGNLTQRDFAQKLGINANTLRSYENGRSLPNQEFLKQVCVQFSVSPSWLLLGRGAMEEGKGNDSGSSDREYVSKRAVTQPLSNHAVDEAALVEKIRLLEELLRAKDEVIKAKDEVIKALGVENEAKNKTIRALEDQLDTVRIARGEFVERNIKPPLQQRPPHY
ncbi:MAG: helix-turn-helix domain-containing protein [Desulfovibrionaceae bacterium]|nr:helix-turn-helix domain-containing protein [Desulfovibrionaceae bacterium]